ncbi:MAG TPA: hypothetical protein VHO84_16620 [Syntrophorhabdaceae bacterium]|nr:hypothetical protein [Syntrophorhabdaceae bacterium]
MIVDVAFPIPSQKMFSYMVPEGMEALASMYVRVKAPFHNRVQIGYITGIRDGGDTNLKHIIDFLDFFPLINDDLIELGKWASDHYVTPPGIVLKYLLPPALKTDPYLHVYSDNPIHNFVQGLPLKKAIRMSGKAKIHSKYVQGLISLRDQFTETDFVPLKNDANLFTGARNTLLIASVENRMTRYIEAIEETFRQDLNVLMLLPDRDSIGYYFQKRLEECFKNRVLWYGSEVTSKSKMSVFFKARNNSKLIVLGNKSCVFLPISKLGLIIIERPEEDEYRNEEAFRFNAVSVALKRASVKNTRCLIGSVCPPVEIYHYCSDNGFQISEQRWLTDDESQARFETSSSVNRGTLHENIIASVQKWTRENERVALFVPWKFYGSGIVCHSCREARVCTQCGSILGYEKESGTFVCISCRAKYPYESRCPNCGNDIITFSKVGLEYMAEKLVEALPDLEIERITGDSSRDKRRKRLEHKSHKPVLLIGTQSLAKMYGVHVKRLILIGLEELRTAGGYRSDEKMIQILMNLLDALTPEHVLFLNARRTTTDFVYRRTSAQYYQEELETRRAAGFPPYARIFLVKIRNKDESRGELLVALMSEILRKHNNAGALTGTIVKKRGSYFEWNTVLRVEDAGIYDSLREIYNIRGIQIEPDPVEV